MVDVKTNKDNAPVTADSGLNIVTKAVADSKIAGSLDLGYAVLTHDGEPKRSDVEKALLAAQAWEVPTPHSQDPRYTLTARAQMLRDLSNLLATLPEKGDK